MPTRPLGGASTGIRAPAEPGQDGLQMGPGAEERPGGGLTPSYQSLTGCSSRPTFRPFSPRSLPRRLTCVDSCPQASVRCGPGALAEAGGVGRGGPSVHPPPAAPRGHPRGLLSRSALLSAEQPTVRLFLGGQEPPLHLFWVVLGGWLGVENSECHTW